MVESTLDFMTVHDETAEASGVALASYLDFGVVLIHIRLSLTGKLLFEEASAWSDQRLQTATFSGLGWKAEGVVKALQIIRTKIVPCFGDVVRAYHDDHYTILTCLDLAPGDVEPLALLEFLHSPMDRSSVLTLRDDYLARTVRDADISIYSNFSVLMAEHRMITIAGPPLAAIRESIGIEAESISSFDITAQVTIVLYRALADMCMLNSIRQVLRQYTGQIPVHEVRALRATFKLAVGSTTALAYYPYHTAVDMLFRMRDRLHHGTLAGLTSGFLDSLDQVVEEQNARVAQRLKDGAALILSLLAVGMDSWPSIVLGNLLKPLLPGTTDEFVRGLAAASLVFTLMYAYAHLARRPGTAVRVGTPFHPRTEPPEMVAGHYYQLWYPASTHTDYTSLFGPG